MALLMIFFATDQRGNLFAPSAQPNQATPAEAEGVRMPAFSINLTSAGSEAELTVVGDVDVAVVSELEAMAQLGLDTTESHTLIVDLGAVTFIDSSGVAALVSIRNAAQAISKAVQLRNVPPAVRRVLDVVALSRLFDLD